MQALREIGQDHLRVVTPGEIRVTIAMTPRPRDGSRGEFVRFRATAKGAAHYHDGLLARIGSCASCDWQRPARFPEDRFTCRRSAISQPVQWGRWQVFITPGRTFDVQVPGGKFASNGDRQFDAGQL